MTGKVQDRNWISSTRWQMVAAALALAFALVPGVVATQSAQDAPTYNLLYSFTGGTDGGKPVAGLIRDAAGNLYGTTDSGGDADWGTVFKVDTTGTETVLYSFTDGTDGAVPESRLVLDAAGNLYGVTDRGGDPSCGADGCGTVFKLDTFSNLIVLHSFTGGADGSLPVAGLVRDAAGNLYGTTSGGTAVVFKLDASGNLTVLYSFNGGNDGSLPDGLLFRDAAGNLYGTTAEGGGSLSCANGCGTVFKLDASGNETILHSFTGGADGALPEGGVIRDSAGNLYGTTYEGGASGTGVVFKLDATGNETVLYTFTGGRDGRNPSAGVIRGAAGNLFGTTTNGGAYGYGVVFKLDPSGREIVLHSFASGVDGAYPYAALIGGNAATFYGTASRGDASDGGVVFRISVK